MPRPATVAAIAASLAVSVPLIGTFEGLRNDPYLDVVGVATVCYGETRVKMRRYTTEECKSMLTVAVGEFTEGVLKITPSLENHPYQLAAAVSLAYNIGINGYRNSSAARQFNQGNFKQACYNFLAWNKVKKNGKLVVSQGLNNRRVKERQICLTDV